MGRPDTDTRHAARCNPTGSDPDERCRPSARAVDGQDEVALDQQHKEPYDAQEISACTGTSTALVSVPFSSSSRSQNQGATAVEGATAAEGAAGADDDTLRQIPQMSMARGRAGWWAHAEWGFQGRHRA